MTRGRKTAHGGTNEVLKMAPFTPLDCNKPAFRHLRTRGPGYESMHRSGVQVEAPERFEVPKKSRRARK